MQKQKPQFDVEKTAGNSSVNLADNSSTDLPKDFDDKSAEKTPEKKIDQESLKTSVKEGVKEYSDLQKPSVDFEVE